MEHIMLMSTCTHFHGPRLHATLIHLSCDYDCACNSVVIANVITAKKNVVTPCGRREIYTLYIKLYTYKNFNICFA